MADKDFGVQVGGILASLTKFLIEKNRRYGNSALKPLQVFAKGEADGALFVRIDDKLSRIRNSEEPRKNDITDLMGYLVLLCLKYGWTDFSDLID